MTGKRPSIILDTIEIGGEHGNVFAVLAQATKIMRKRNESPEKIHAMQAEVWQSGSYAEALAIIAQFAGVAYVMTRR